MRKAIAIAFGEAGYMTLRRTSIISAPAAELLADGLLLSASERGSALCVTGHDGTYTSLTFALLSNI
jgi:hypothetical protein